MTTLFSRATHVGLLLAIMDAINNYENAEFMKEEKQQLREMLEQRKKKKK